MYKIAVMGGDGTGPSVVAEALKVLNVVEKKYNLDFKFTHLNYGGQRYLDTGTVSSRSTDENLRMLIFPYEMEGWFHGEGFFFSEPSIFYRGTDLGWIRLLLFGGVPFVLIFIVLNLAPIFLMNKKQFSIKMILIALFFIMNFKGIFIISFFSGFIMTYLWLLNSSPVLR